MIQSGSNNTTGQQELFKPLYHSTLILISILVTGHNLLVLIVYILERTLHTTTNFLLCNLACCDILTGCIFLPLLIASSVFQGIPKLNFAVNVFTDITGIGIVLSLTVVTIERYINLCYPFKYPEIVSKFKVRVTVAVIWSVAVILSLIPLSWSYWQITHNNAAQSDGFVIAYRVHSSIILVFFLIPTIISLYALISMFCTIHRLTNTDIMATAATRRKRQRRVVVVFLAMYICLIICWTPMIAVRMLMDFGHFEVGGRHISQWALELFVILRGLPSFTNPLIYVWCKADFRKAVLKIKAIEKVNTFTTRAENKRMALLEETKGNGEMIERTNGHSNGQTMFEE